MASVDDSENESTREPRTDLELTASAAARAESDAAASAVQRPGGVPGWMVFAIIALLLYAFMRSKAPAPDDDVPDWVKRQIGVQDTVRENDAKVKGYGDRRP